MDNMRQYPQHGAAMSGFAAPPEPTAGRWPRLLAAGCAGAAALLVLVSSFLPLYSVTATIEGEQASISITSWGFDVTIGERYGTVPISGYLLIFATVLLLAAAVLCCVAASRVGTPGAPRAANLVTVAATAFLTGAVWAIGMEVIAHAGAFQLPRDATPEEVASFEEGPGVGLWLLMAAVAVAVAAMILTLRSTHAPRAAQRDEPDTPRHGVPMPYQATPVIPQPQPGGPQVPPAPPTGRS